MDRPARWIPETLSAGAQAGRRFPAHRAARRTEWLDDSRPLDERPLPGCSGHARSLARRVAEERAADGVHVRWTPRHHQDGHPEHVRQLVDVDHVEPGDRDSLEHDRAHVGRELAAPYELNHFSRGVRTIPPYAAAHDTVEPGPRAHGAHEQHVAPMVALERPVVEPEDVHRGLPA